MTLDAETRALLDAAAALPPVAPEAQSVESVRQAMLALAVTGTPPVEEVRDRRIPGPGGPIDLRCYRPSRAGELPALVFFHGGGWVLGSIDHTDHLCRRLALESGCAVVSVEYRLAPEHPFPAGLEDCHAAVAWIARHGSEIGVDGTRLAVGGESAGGNLAAAVCLLARDRGGPRLAHQLLLYPVTDCDFERASMCENGDGYLLTRDAMRWFWNLYAGDAHPETVDPLAAPLRAESLRDLPPAFIVTASYDPLLDEGELYGERLRDAGVPVQVSRYEAIHGFMTMASAIPSSAPAIAEAAASISRALGGAS